MTWFRRLSRKSRITRGNAAQNRRRRRANITEQLEQKLLLGSMVPTETGVPTGELLPISAVELLSPQQRQNLSASDISLLESEGRFEQIKHNLQQLADSHPGANPQVDARESGEATTVADSESSQSDHAEQEHTEATNPSAEPSVKQQTVEDSSVETDLGLLLAMDASSENASEEGDPESAADGEKENSQTDSARDEEDETDSDTDTPPVSNEDSSGEDDQDRQESGSRQSTSNVDLTFAGGQGPTAAPRPAALGATSRGGGSGSDTPSVVFPGDASIPSSASSSSVTSETTSESASSNGDQVVIRYDFRNFGGYQNEVTAAEMASAEAAFGYWEQATDNQIQFVQDETAPDSEVVIIYKGALEAVGHESSPGEILALGGTIETRFETGESEFQRIVLVDHTESIDAQVGNGNPAGTFDFATIVGHEIGHVLGLEDSTSGFTGDIMKQSYDRERGLDTYEYAVEEYDLSHIELESPEDAALHGLHAMITDYPQLTAAEVTSILSYATQVTPSEDAIIAIVDRGGRILGVRVEAGVDAGIQADPQLLTFAIDGAVAKARTAAFFSNGDPINGTLAPLTSRLVRFVSQSTVTFREVNANPNSADPLVEGPGFVAPIGLGGHFPPEIMFTPPVDLFAIEHTNRDSIVHPGEDGERGTADDITLTNRFNIDTAHVPLDTDGDGFPDNRDTNMDNMADSLRLSAPESYGFVSGVFPAAQARGIATLPGGIPLFRDTDGDNVGETLIGGIGVFFPGTDGTAVFEQDFQAGVGQTEFDRTNAPKVLEAEFIATVAAGGSNGGNAVAPGAKPPFHPVPDLDIPFGRLDLVGIQLEVIGPTPGIRGVQELVAFGNTLGPLTGAVNGADQQVTTMGDLSVNGESVPFGWLVTPHDGGDFDGIPGPDITAAEVEQIINQARAEAELVRAAVRLPISSRTRMVFAVTDRGGEVLGLFRMRDATVFSIDVAVAKARNTAYYADAGELQAIDQIPGVPAGTAFTNRTIRFLAEPRFPDGIDDGAPNEVFSILSDIADATGLPLGGKANGIALVDSTAPINISAFDSVLGYDAFHPNTNFRDPGDGVIGSGDPATDAKRHQNGIVFFPGSGPVYGSSDQLIGGFGVSGDGVDQDDVVTFAGSQGFAPPDATVRADEVFVAGVRLPYQKFLRNPHG